MADVSPYLPDLLRLVKRHYPDWNDFTHPQFVADEIEYKHEASRLAKEMLNREALEDFACCRRLRRFPESP